MTPARRFPFGHEPASPPPEPAPAPTASAPPHRPLETAPLDSFLPPPRVLPFRAATILPPRAVQEAPPCAVAVSMPAPSRARRWLRLAFIVLGLLAYAAVLLGIVAPESWWH